jgi:uncharacterized protein YggE
MDTLEKNKKRVFSALTILLIIFSIYCIVKIYSEIKKDSMLGENTTPATISFSGHGEVKATPDVANIYFTITKDAKTVEDAQAGVAAVEKSALDVLNAKGVDEKDIQTTDASFNPKYEYKQAVCPIMPLSSNGSAVVAPTYCPSGKQTLVGYTASESITVKIRNTDNVGIIMQSLGTTGISDLSGPDFTIDNPDMLQIQARKIAIDDAKNKAQILAKDLGVSLGKITDFSESGETPVMYAANKVMPLSAEVPAATGAVIPQGQNTITSDVTITYEIK